MTAPWRRGCGDASGVSLSPGSPAASASAASARYRPGRLRSPPAQPGAGPSRRRAPPRGGRAVDLCTGSGAVAAHLSVAVPRATVVGVDIDPRAARCARRNGVAVVLGALGQRLRARAFDVVTAVAPYVRTGTLPLLPRDVRRYGPGSPSTVARTVSTWSAGSWLPPPACSGPAAGCWWSSTGTRTGPCGRLWSAPGSRRDAVVRRRR